MIRSDESKNEIVQRTLIKIHGRVNSMKGNVKVSIYGV